MTRENHLVDGIAEVGPEGAAPTSVEVEVHERPVLVVGGGTHAIGPVSRLLRAGARVTVVAPWLETAVEDLVERDLVTWAAREYEPTDLEDVGLVAAATGVPGQDARVLADAVLQGVPHLAVRSAAQPAGQTRPSPDTAARPFRGSTVSPSAPPSDTSGVSATPEMPETPGTSATPGTSTPSTPRLGSVVLVGGGPGAPDLITVAGRRAVLGSDVVVVDRLAPLPLLAELDPHVEVVDVSKIPRGRFTPQEEINAVLVDRARAGLRVARLKGGDPFVFGRGMEEQLACEEAGIPVEVIPGVTSAVSAPALAGIPVTHRGMVQGFAVVSGHAAPRDPRSTVDWAALGASGVTIIVLMGVHTLPEIARALVEAGRDGATPVACVMDAALASQRVHHATLADLTTGAPPEVTAPAVTVIGDVAAFGVPDRVVSSERADR